MPDPYSQGSAGYTVPGPQGAPGAIGPTGPAGQSTAALVQSTALTLGRAAQLDPAQSGKIRSVLSAMYRYFVGLVTTTQASGTQQTYVYGPIPKTLIDLGAGGATAVGVNAAGVPVRVTDPTCVSGLNYLGHCDESGAMFLRPHRADCYEWHAYGLVPDWDGTTGTDNLAAFTALLAAAKRDAALDYSLNRTQRIHLSGSFYLSDTIHIQQGVVLYGDGRNAPMITAAPYFRPGTQLVFAKGVHGLRFHSATDADETTPAPGGGTVTWVNPKASGGWPTAANSVVRDLTLVALGFAFDADSMAGCGLFSSCQIIIENVHVEGFGDDGIRIRASEYVSNNGNANGSSIKDCVINLCNGAGVYVGGGDSNAVAIDHCNISVTRRPGIQIGENQGTNVRNVQCAGTGYNKPGDPVDFTKKNEGPFIDYWCRGAVSSSVFEGCYTEGQGAAVNAATDGGAFIDAPAIVLGGKIASVGGFHPSSTAIILNGQEAPNAPLTHRSTRSGLTILSALGSQEADIDGSVSLLRFSFPTLGHHSDLRYEKSTKYFNWEIDASGLLRPISIPLGAESSRRAAPLFLNGIGFGYYGTERYTVGGSAAPVAGDWLAGDYIRNMAYTELGTGGSKYIVRGWACIASGTPGTWVEDRGLTGN